jgi:ribosomal protein S6
MSGTTEETRRKDSLLVNETREPRAYELMSVLIPDLSDDDTGAAIERVSGYITSLAGEISEILTDSPWGRRRLAYTIRFNSQDYRDGVYVVTHFNAVPSAITDIERELKLDTSVMRYLLVMDDPKAGEQVSEQDEVPAAAEADTTTEAPAPAAAPTAETKEPAAVTESAPAEAEEAPVADSGDQASDQAPAEAEEAPATKEAQSGTPVSNSKLPTEGEGTDWVAGDGTNNIPDGFTLKGNASSKIYHPEASGSYNNTIAEIYFATPEAAEAAGYRLPKNLQQAGASAAGTAASIAQKAADAAEALPDEENPAPADAATDKED